MDKPFESLKKHFEQAIAIELTDEQLKQLYDGVYPYIETSVYAEMEHILASIHTTYDAMIQRKEDEIRQKEGKRDTLKKIEGYAKTQAIVFMDIEENFQQFVKHVVANYRSLQKQRLDILVTKNKWYQSLESHLFDQEVITKHGFKRAYALHKEILQALYRRFDVLLFEGHVLDSDGVIDKQVIIPVLEDFEKILANDKEGGEDEQAKSVQKARVSEH